MNELFVELRVGPWLDWIGQPLLYDGCLCVCRTADDVADKMMHFNQTLIAGD